MDRSAPTLLNTITGVTSISSGAAHTLARTWDGQVYSWGSNTSGRLGDGTTTQRTLPVHVSTLTNIVAVAAGDMHRAGSYDVTRDGRFLINTLLDNAAPTPITLIMNWRPGS